LAILRLYLLGLETLKQYGYYKKPKNNYKSEPNIHPIGGWGMYPFILDEKGIQNETKNSMKG
jgi:hypothetical protein